MSRKIKIYLIHFFILLGFGAFAQTPKGFSILKDPSSLKKSLIEENQKINTTESDFFQEKYLSVLSEKIESKGSFFFKKPNELRWEYTSPFEYVIVLTSGKMYIKNDGKVSRYNVNSNKMFKGINDMMMSVVNGNLFENPDYKVKYFVSSKSFLIELLPANVTTQKFLKSIQMTVNKTDFEIENVRMTEPGGDYTNIKFLNRKNNVVISDAKFKI
ncbi:outer membrane lipoprotein carrier protein LolA [uncultured Arcticibacterium sp.]|uniref:LolA family protein n=1 Tax=uncultured Arcticibacterium sp. TaxID=2173042 RepID=UPI0030FC40D1